MSQRKSCYHYTLPNGYVLTPGEQYWIEIAGFAAGVPAWAIAGGAGGDSVYFESFVGYAGGTQYRFRTGDAAFSFRAEVAAVLEVTPNPDHSVTVMASGISTYGYITQRSTNLVDWAAIATNTAPAGGVFQVQDFFSDLGSNSPSRAFYRLLMQ